MMEQHDKQLLLQMECIPTQILTIIFISTWIKKVITQKTQKGKKFIQLISLLFSPHIEF